MKELDIRNEAIAGLPRGSDEDHYFVSHGLGWKTGSTLEEAMDGAFCTSFYGDMKGWLRNIHKNGDGFGIPAFSCRVLAPADTDYSIEWFCPKGVEIAECKNLIVTYVTQKKVVWQRDPVDEIKKLRAALKDLDWCEEVLT